jgi:hypothetical protein
MCGPEEEEKQLDRMGDKLFGGFGKKIAIIKSGNFKLLSYKYRTQFVRRIRLKEMYVVLNRAIIYPKGTL